MRELTTNVLGAATRLRAAHELGIKHRYESVWPSYANRRDIEKLVEYVLGPIPEVVEEPEVVEQEVAPWEPPRSLKRSQHMEAPAPNATTMHERAAS